MLLLEDSVFERLSINQIFDKYFDQCALVQTGSLSEAQTVIANHSFDLYLVDLNLPDGNGLDFISDVKTVHPGAKVIIYTSAVDGEWTLSALSMGVDQRIQKPLVEAEFAAAVRLLMGLVGDNNSFTGRIRSMSLLDIIQLKCLNRLSCNLMVSHGVHIGLIQIDNGEIVHSEAEALQGADAFLQILSWKDGHIQDLELTSYANRTIDTNWESLVMDAAQFADEAN